MTINMSGQNTDIDEEKTTTHDPAEFLDENGNFDFSKTYEIRNRQQDNVRIDSETCIKLRRLLASGMSASAVAENVGAGKSTVRDHATGKCHCDHDEGIVEYDRSTESWSYK